MGIAANGTNLWVANLSGNTVQEFSCMTGSSIRSIDTRGLDSPIAVAVGGTKVWVANPSHLYNPVGNMIMNSSFVTAFSTTSGSLDRSVTGTNANGLDGSIALSVSRGKVWIANANGNSVTELDSRQRALDSRCRQ